MEDIFRIYLGDIEQDTSAPKKVLKLTQVFEEAVKDFDKGLIRKLVKLSYDAECLGEKYTKLKKKEKDLNEVIQKNLAVEHNNGFVFITVNPRDDVSFQDFDKQVRKLIKRNMFGGALAVYEQRGKTEKEIGKGFHAHILASRNLNYKPSKVAKNSRNTFKDVCNVKASHLLNIQFIGPDFASDKQEYILGTNKTGDDKDLKQNIDKLWRSQFGIDDYLGEKII